MKNVDTLLAKKYDKWRREAAKKEKYRADSAGAGKHSLRWIHEPAKSRP